VPSPLEVSGSAFGRSDIVQLSAFPTKGRPPVAKTARRLAKGVTRREFIALVRAVEECTRTLQLQFTRIAQIQAELDHIRTILARSKRPKE
jgi:hypothetical protein